MEYLTIDQEFDCLDEMEEKRTAMLLEKDYQEQEQEGNQDYLLELSQNFRNIYY